MAGGILPDQGWNPCLLHLQVDSQPLDGQGSPRLLRLRSPRAGAVHWLRLGLPLPWAWGFIPVRGSSDLRSLTVQPKKKKANHIHPYSFQTLAKTERVSNKVVIPGECCSLGLSRYFCQLNVWRCVQPRLTLLWPHGLWPTRLLRPWDSPGKDAGLGSHFLLQGDLPDLGIEPTCPVISGLADFQCRYTKAQCGEERASKGRENGLHFSRPAGTHEYHATHPDSVGWWCDSWHQFLEAPGSPGRGHSQGCCWLGSLQGTAASSAPGWRPRKSGLISCVSIPSSGLPTCASHGPAQHKPPYRPGGRD